jgi:hypothetical protein
MRCTNTKDCASNAQRPESGERQIARVGFTKQETPQEGAALKQWIEFNPIAEAHTNSTQHQQTRYRQTHQQGSRVIPVDSGSQPPSEQHVAQDPKEKDKQRIGKKETAGW